VRVVLIALAVALGGVAGCGGSEESPPDTAFGDMTEKDRTGLAAVGRAMSDFAHEYAVYARLAKQNNLSAGARSVGRMAEALNRAEHASFDSRKARQVVRAYLDSMRLLVRRNARFVRLLMGPNTDDEAVIRAGEAIRNAAAAAQRTNRGLAGKVRAAVAGDRRRELAHAFTRVHLQLLRETDPEAYRRASRAAE
jgi:hypothetical protein